MNQQSHTSHIVFFCITLMLVWVSPGHGQEQQKLNRDVVKVAAVQISGYDKGDVPRPEYDPTADLLPYIDRAGKDGAQLVVFPEYVLGHIPVPGPTQRESQPRRLPIAFTSS
ncbi:MAG: hypothetical protein P8J37_18845 [Fuerstiella sp.]|nr:hypothetical protein [Fuerstiella sp.]